MTAIPVHEQKLVVIVPKGHPLAERKAVSLEETLPYPQIYFAKGSEIRNVVDRLFEDIEAKPRFRAKTRRIRLLRVWWQEDLELPWFLTWICL